MYCRGEGVSQDYAGAIALYHQAAEQGVVAAQLPLGLSYREGEYVEQDFAEAMKWFLKAAAQKHPDAQMDIGLM